jgi:hypothetical protein
MTENLNVEELLSDAIRHFWLTRQAQTSRQGTASGVVDAGNRRAVTGGKHFARSLYGHAASFLAI